MLASWQAQSEIPLIRDSHGSPPMTASMRTARLALLASGSQPLIASLSCYICQRIRLAQTQRFPRAMHRVRLLDCDGEARHLQLRGGRFG